jgi:hypothetical protein
MARARSVSSNQSSGSNALALGADPVISAQEAGTTELDLLI